MRIILCKHLKHALTNGYVPWHELRQFLHSPYNLKITALLKTDVKQIFSKSPPKLLTTHVKVASRP